MLNKVCLIGRIGQIQVKDKMITASLATTKRIKDKEPQTSWHNLVIFNTSLCSLFSQYIHKGDMLYIEGELNYYKYQDKTTTNIIVDKAVILNSKKEPEQEEVAVEEDIDLPPF